MVQIFTTFTLWNEIGDDGSPVQLSNGEFFLSNNKKEYRFVFKNIGSDKIIDDGGVYVVARQFKGKAIYDRFPNNGELNFSPLLC
eukprot:scaffold19811_cov84-Cylindrotheca_fusiformis.AAC.2